MARKKTDAEIMREVRIEQERMANREAFGKARRQIEEHDYKRQRANWAKKDQAKRKEPIPVIEKDLGQFGPRDTYKAPSDLTDKLKDTLRTKSEEEKQERIKKYQYDRMDYDY